MKESKTPNFDLLLDRILKDLIPHERVCLDCKIEFKIEKEDIDFLKMFRCSAPKLCPDCRQRNRLAFANYSNIYKRKCNVPGHTDTMISPVAPIMPWITYDHETYYSDLWDPIDYGLEVDNDKPFFDQYLDLLKKIPQPGVRRGSNSINCDFSFYGKNMKDCYYLFGGRDSEDIMFSSSIYSSRHIVDSYFLRKVENAYENIITIDCFKTKYAYFSSNCVECDFIYDCRNCQNCLGCVNLRNKNYCIFNEQFEKEEYFKKREEIDLGSRATFDEYKNKFWKFVKTNPVRATRLLKSENCVGNEIIESRDCTNSYQVSNCENVRYGAFAIMNQKDSMDIGHSGSSGRFYNCQNIGTNSSDIKFSFAIKECLDCEYTMSSTNCRNCFGCVALKNASYMIFNKKYEPNEYYKRIDQIKTKMLEEGTYGEFLPMNFSPCAYNSSFAHVIYPMTEDEAQKRGVFWQKDVEADTKNLKSLNANELPDNISEVEYNICDVAIIGEYSGKPFRLIKREIDFYKQNKIPLPVDTPYQRMLDRFTILNNFKIFEETCYSCGIVIKSAYKKSDGYKPYCGKCYQQEVY